MFPTPARLSDLLKMRLFWLDGGSGCYGGWCAAPSTPNVESHRWCVLARYLRIGLNLTGHNVEDGESDSGRHPSVTIVIAVMCRSSVMLCGMMALAM